MRSGFLAKWLVGFVLFAATAASALAAPVRFNFTFLNGPASASGYIVVESTLVNPGLPVFLALPNPAVLDLQVTVSGAAAGNGTFGIASFAGVVFSTAGSVLDFSHSLMGQAAGAGLWGTTAGDFNLFGTGAPAPAGIAPFTLGANNGVSTQMTLTAMNPVVGVPALDEWMLAMLALVLGGAGILLVRRGSPGSPAG